MSPRLPPAAIIHLLKSTNSHKLVISSSTLSELVKGIKEELVQQHADYPVQLVEFPTLDALYPTSGDEEDVTSSTSEVNGDEGKYAGGVFLHSSGSTGLPKPIRLSNRVITSYAHLRECSYLIPFTRGLSMNALRYSPRTREQPSYSSGWIHWPCEDWCYGSTFVSPHGVRYSGSSHLILDLASV